MQGTATAGEDIRILIPTKFLICSFKLIQAVCARPNQPEITPFWKGLYLVPRDLFNQINGVFGGLKRTQSLFLTVEMLTYAGFSSGWYSAHTKFFFLGSLA